MVTLTHVKSLTISMGVLMISDRIIFSDNIAVCCRFKPLAVNPLDDPVSDYMNLLGMILSMCGLLMKVRVKSKSHCQLVRQADWLNVMLKDGQYTDGDIFLDS